MQRVVRHALFALCLLATPAVAQEATAPLEVPGATGAVPEISDTVMPLAPEVLPGVPPARRATLPRARWEHRRGGDLWTRVAMSAMASHGRPLLDTVPSDIEDWCPAYPGASNEDRAAFWTAFLSTLSRYESTFNPRAVGGGGLWFGLLQIYPQTAEFRKCRVRTGEGLKHGPSNLNCAIRIMSVTVPRDNAISVKDGRWKGVAADWGPIRNDWMRRDMQRYTRKQTYCRPLSAVRPRARPTL